MSFEQIVGQDLAKRMLQNGLRHSKLSHAYLFSGPAGTGKEQMALCLSKAIFCLYKNNDACGECVECRKVEHRNHPGVHMIQPDGAVIKIEQIKELQHELSFRSTSEQARVYVIQQVEKMTTPAANSLLKFLEEPHANIVAILISDNGQAVLPTIQSRVQWIPFLPMVPERMLPILIEEGQPELLALPAVHLVSGIERAREMIQFVWFAEIRNIMIQLAKAASVSLASASVMIQRDVIRTERVEHIEILLALFVLWYKDMIHIQCGHKDRVIFIDEMDWLTSQAYQCDVRHWVHCMEQAVETRKRLRSYANPQLALEYFMGQIQGG